MQTYEAILKAYIRRGAELGAQHLREGQRAQANADARMTLFLARILARYRAQQKESSDAYQETLRDEAQTEA